MSQINHEVLTTKINNRKHLCIKLKGLQANLQLQNGWTSIYHVFQHLYDQNRRGSC